MGSKKGSENESSQQGRNKPEPSSFDNQLESLPLLDEFSGSLESSDFPDHSTARPLRQAMVLREQQQRGNAYVQRMLANHNTNGQIQRQPEEDEQLSTEGLGLEEELVGHPFSDILPDIQRDGDGDGGGTTANITLTSETPNESRPSQAEIEAAHGGTNTVGWTTPHDDITVPSMSASSISVAINLRFDIELASEYTGERLTVLTDHENHHPTIARNVAQQYLVDNLRTALQAMSDFRDSSAIQSAIQSAHADFVSHESTEARSFDSTDYPRMEAAYYGVRTPLADLMAATAEVQTMVSAVDAFNSAATTEPEAAVEEGESPEQANSSRLISIAQPVIDARSALAAIDVQRLQYNGEFKGKVATASGHISTLGGGSLNEAAQTKLQELQTTLGSFTWTPV
jgi:hypothetical protein